MPAPPKNRNATRHGLRSASLPKGASYIERTTNELRRAIEDAVLDAKGEVSILDAATIQTIIRRERHAMLCQRWLRREHDRMTLAERLRFSSEIGRASAARDAALRSLGLERTASDIWSTIYSTPLTPPQPSDGPEAAETHERASDEAVGDDTSNAEGL